MTIVRNSDSGSNTSSLPSGLPGTERVPAGQPDIALLIPAYRPSEALNSVVEALSREQWAAIVVVDDGSGPEYSGLFESLTAYSNVIVLRHAVNLGKGSALKTGINAILCAYPAVAGIVTADADGQHDPEDVHNVVQRFRENPSAIVLGTRAFNSDVPLRSRIGNQITKWILRAVLGQRLNDTQTGLRAIPRALLPHLLKVPAPGYEFELEMLIGVKHLGIEIVQQSIRTIYQPGNPSSHFQPLRDSMRIYFVLLRFTFIALLTAGLDNVVFFLVYLAGGSVLASQVCGRAFAVLFNYSAVRRAVFCSDERHRILLPRYLLLVIANGALAYAGIKWLTNSFGMGVLPAKLLVETFIFVANFVIQRDFVFTRRGAAPAATNWDLYYRSVPATAHLTRRYTGSVLISTLKRYAGSAPLTTIAELGGANSCFLTRILDESKPARYHVIDQNQYGLDLLRERFPDSSNVLLHQADVLKLPNLGLTADVVFSIGLVEHFDPPQTRQAIDAHFALLQPDGIAIISYPTPTWLYSIARTACEALGLWHFPDERPLRRKEVYDSVSRWGDVVFEKTLWPLIFTQHLMVIRKTRTPVQ